ncbi:hypothetical protein L596_013159 [Steinernema carpocapsae]|nr:hypothetical protein L596_013159 [Steinernema carpocapsae]
MAGKGTIFMPFSCTDKTSDPVDIGDFKCTLVGAYHKCPRNALESGQRCQIIRCQPKTDGRTTLWSCSAVGTLARTNSSKDDQFVFHFWNASFGNGYTEFHAHYNELMLSKACNIVAGSENRVYLEVDDSFIADLSQPNNPLIASHDDVAKLKIDGEEIWVPKKGLSYHSKFFDVFFNGDFKEKSEDCYELKDIKLEDFLPFLGIVHCLAVPIDENSLEGLLKLGDFFRCKIVLDRCEEYLKNAPIKIFPLLKKLELAEECKLKSTLADVIGKASTVQLKRMTWEGEMSAYARSLMSLKFRLNDS